MTSLVRSLAQLPKLLTRNCLQTQNSSLFVSAPIHRSSYLYSNDEYSSICNNVSMLSLSNQPVSQYPSLLQRSGYHTLQCSGSKWQYSLINSPIHEDNGNLKLFQPRLLKDPLQESTISSRRSVIVIGYDGKKHSEQVVLDRFRRLGNGMWLRKQTGYMDRLWKKFYKRRKPWKVLRLQRTLICNNWQSKLLDKMVADDVKRQKWYVEDPYKGYTDETFFFYHPKILPGNTLEKPKDHFRYAVRRYNLGNRLRRNRRRQHRKLVDSYRQRPLPPTKNGFSFNY